MSGYKRHSDGRQSSGYLGKRKGRQSFDITKQDQQKTLKQDVYKYLYAATVQDQQSEPKEDQETTGLSIIEFAKLLSNAALEEQHEVSQALVDCASEISFRTSMYATLSGLLNVDDTNLGQEIVNLAMEKLQKSLDTNNHTCANLILRFLMYSTNSKLVDTQSACKFLHYFVQQAIARSTNRTENPRLWQPFTDFLVCIAMLAIPYGLPEIAEGARDEFNHLMKDLDTYMNQNRLIKFQPGLRNFLADSEGVSEDDPVLEFDSGGAGFLERLYKAVLELEQEEWKVQSINQYHIQAEQILAKGSPHKIYPHTLVIKEPNFEDSTCSVHQCVRLAQAYPPRGFIALLPSTFTERNLPKMERIIVENHTIDTIMAFKGHISEAATKLTNELEEAQKPLILETVYGQLLKLPEADLPIIGYASFIAGLSQTKLISKSLGTLINQNLRPKIGFIDYELRYRLAIQLSLHISNLQFYWPWSKWDEVAEKPLDDPQRRFITFLLIKLQEISFFDKLEQIFTDFEKKQSQALQQKQAKDGENADDQPKPEVKLKLRNLLEPLRFQYTTIQQSLDSHQNSNQEGGDMQVEKPAHELEELQIANQFLEQIANKVQGEAMTSFINEQVEKVLGDEEKRLSSLSLILRAMMRALIERGIKTNTHSLTMFRRYKQNIQDLVGQIDAFNPDVKATGERQMIRICEDTLLRNQQKLEVVCSQLMNMALVRPTHIICHLVESQHMTFEDKVCRDMSYYEIICNAIDQCCSKIEEKEFIIKYHLERVAELHALSEGLKKIEEDPDSQNGRGGGGSRSGNGRYDSEEELDQEQTNGAGRKRYLNQQDYEQIEEYENEALDIEKEIQEERVKISEYKDELKLTVVKFFDSYITQILDLAQETKHVQVIQMRYMFSSLIRKYALQCSEYWPEVQTYVLSKIEEGREEIEEFILQYICY